MDNDVKIIGYTVLRKDNSVVAFSEQEYRIVKIVERYPQDLRVGVVIDG